MCLKLHKVSGIVLDTVITATNTYIFDNKNSKVFLNIQLVFDGTNYIFILTYRDTVGVEPPP